MAEAQLVDVGALDDLESGATMRVDVGDRRIVLVRIDDSVYALGDRCTHAEVSLAEGDVDASERTIECWRHGSQFSLETGAPLSLPATKPTPTYDVVVRDGRILLEVR